MAPEDAASNPYQAMTAELARQALAAARDASPHRPRGEEWICSLTVGVPAARLLAGGTENAASDEAGSIKDGFDQLTSAARAFRENRTVRFTDGFGHSRPTYGLLLIHIQLSALHVASDRLSDADRAACFRQLDAIRELVDLLQQTHLTDEGNETVESRAAEVAMRLWLALCRLDLALLQAERTDDAAALQLVNEQLKQGDKLQALHPRDASDPIDDWTYRELVALHALDRLAGLAARNDWREAVRLAALFHEGHTQPDYITYQPWALAAFAREADTRMFAEQQLHDVTVHLNTGGAAAALVPALLLADAAASLSAQ
jgi:hypothetical protein